MIFFSDAGPFGETDIQNKKGSVYVIDMDDRLVRPLALNCLAYPCGLCLDMNEDFLFVAETFENRILRFYVSEEGNYNFSVFH